MSAFDVEVPGGPVLRVPYGGACGKVADLDALAEFRAAPHELLRMPYPFHWVPAEGQRHATLDERPGGGYPTGHDVTTLCGRELTADDSEHGWFWATCFDCAPETRRIAAGHSALPQGHFG